MDWHHQQFTSSGIREPNKWLCFKSCSFCRANIYYRWPSLSDFSGAHHGFSCTWRQGSARFICCCITAEGVAWLHNNSVPNRGERCCLRNGCITINRAWWLHRSWRSGHVIWMFWRQHADSVNQYTWRPHFSSNTTFIHSEVKELFSRVQNKVMLGHTKYKEE